MDPNKLKDQHIDELKTINKIDLSSKEIEELDVNNYLLLTEEESNKKKIGHSLSQRMFIDAVINILDKFMEKTGRSFNRLIFLYIVEISRLNKDSHIQL